MAIAKIKLSNLNGTNGFRLDGEMPGDYAGYSVSDAGDVNGDGYADLIIGAAKADPNGTSSGSSYVVFGKASGFSAVNNLSNLNGNNGFRLEGEKEGDYSGYSVSGAGDINGDGFADLIVGVRRADPNGEYSGASFVVFGKASAYAPTFNLSNVDGKNGFRINGLEPYDNLGNSVSSAGDINGDGLDDLIIGAFGAGPKVPGYGFSFQYGAAYVIFGKDSGFNAEFEITNLNGSNGFSLKGAAVLDSLGFEVSDAGDVNGDGFDDVIIGTLTAEANGTSESGLSYIVFGKATGFSASMNISDLNGSNGFRLDGIENSDFTGRKVSSAGDVNGDGFDDVIVSGFQANPNDLDNAGSSYVVFGKASGFSATMNLANLNGKNGFRLDGKSAGDYAGLGISSAGDVNGDGFDDLIITASREDPNGIYNAGTTYVLYGKSSGFQAKMNLSSINGNNGFRIEGEGVGENAGNEAVYLVSKAGDINGDGFGDMVFGSLFAGPQNEGQSHVLFGSNFNGKVTSLGSSKADHLKGSKSADRFIAGDGDDIISGRGGKDVYHAGAGDDFIEIRDLKFQLADGGAGLDTLKLDSSHLNLNLTKERGHISEIEAIDLKGNGANKLAVTALDVLNLSSTSNTLIVDGNRNDRVVGLDSGWKDGGVHGGYHTFSNGEAVLLVGVHVATDFA